MSGGWQPIEAFVPVWVGPFSEQVLLAHAGKKWIRFGRVERVRAKQQRWYYSGTSERSQWSMTEGDAPTHWMPIPKLPHPDHATSSPQ